MTRERTTTNTSFLDLKKAGEGKKKGKKTFIYFFRDFEYAGESLSSHADGVLLYDGGNLDSIFCAKTFTFMAHDYSCCLWSTHEEDCYT